MFSGCSPTAIIGVFSGRWQGVLSYDNWSGGRVLSPVQGVLCPEHPILTNRIYPLTFRGTEYYPAITLPASDWSQHMAFLTENTCSQFPMILTVVNRGSGFRGRTARAPRAEEGCWADPAHQCWPTHFCRLGFYVPVSVSFFILRPIYLSLHSLKPHLLSPQDMAHVFAD